MKEFIITSNDSGQRVDRFSSKLMPALPPALLQKYLRIKRIKLNGRAAKGDERLNQGDVLRLYINDEFFKAPPRKSPAYEAKLPNPDIIYEDANILIADKKPGILCHDADGAGEDTLIARIQAYLRRTGEYKPQEENCFSPALCNRIDRNTGGLVIAAKNAEALRTMNEKIKSREIGKYYLCAVAGRPDPAQGELSSYIVKDDEKNLVSAGREGGKGTKLAVTFYKTLKTTDKLSLVECRIITGRTHQIRVHMSSIHHPVLGDEVYGMARQPFHLSGQTLHASILGFFHPNLKRYMEFEAPWPEYFNDLLVKLT